MRKIVAAINMTIDGFCDHTAGIPDEDLHNHYRDLLDAGDVILYGRKTFELMKYWQTLLQKPSGEKSMDDFAVAIDRIPKIIFSRTLDSSGIGWESASLATRSPEEVAKELREQPGRTIYAGSRSLIVSLANHDLIDEYQLCIHPVLIGKGLPLFDQIRERKLLQLTNTKTFASGAIILYYQKKTNS